MWRPRLQGSFPTAAIPRRGQDLALFGVGAERFRAGGGAAGAFSRSGPRTRGLPRMPGLPTTPPAVTDRSPQLRVGTAPLLGAVAGTALLLCSGGQAAAEL